MEVIRRIFKWTRSHKVLSALFLILLAGGAVFFRIQSRHDQDEVSAPLERGAIIQSVYGIGTVVANRSYQLKPGVTTMLSAVYVKEGESVKRGDRLVRIDQETYRAPFSGTVTYLPNKVGENIFTTVPVLTLVDLQDRYVVVSLEQQGALRVKRNQKVKISFDSIRESNFDGEVKSVYSSELGFLARIDIPDLPMRILPGMTADVAIEIQRHERALLIPVAALEEGQFVWLKQPLPKRVEVKIGIVDKAFAEVTGGSLKEGDQILIHRTKVP